MATRGGIPERKLKPLWDAIDHRQYKPAMKLVTGLLTKHADSPYLFVSFLNVIGIDCFSSFSIPVCEQTAVVELQALKALILEKLGKVEEASELALRAKAANPVDDITLNTLQSVFQRLNMCAYSLLLVG